MDDTTPNGNHPLIDEPSLSRYVSFTFFAIKVLSQKTSQIYWSSELDLEISLHPGKLTADSPKNHQTCFKGKSS